MKTVLFIAIAVFGAMSLVACDSGVSTAAPKVQGTPRPDWKTMSKEEKIALINKQPIPEQAKQEGIRRVQQGID